MRDALKLTEPRIAYTFPVIFDFTSGGVFICVLHEILDIDLRKYPRVKLLGTGVYTAFIDYMATFSYTTNQNAGGVLLQNILNTSVITFTENVVLVFTARRRR
jgi:hypothetical protein